LNAELTCGTCTPRPPLNSAKEMSVSKQGGKDAYHEHWFDGSNRLSKPSCSFCAIAYIITSATLSSQGEQEILQRRIAMTRACARKGKGSDLSSVGWLRRAVLALRAQVPVFLIAVAGRSHPQRRPPARVDVRQHVHRDPVGPAGRVDLGRHGLGGELVPLLTILARRQRL
jgi:hypothetical protein